MLDYDAELRRHHEVLLRACRVQAGDHVLDIGCGAGQTTRAAARAATAGGSVPGAPTTGSALGVDVSAAAIEGARRAAREEGLTNVTFECADAQRHRFSPEHFTLAMSRFGTMFFDDPGAAFAAVGRALRPGGRLVMMVWQARERNEWDAAISRALGGPAALPVAVPEGLDPFSLADPPVVTRLLQAAGFADVAFTDVREPVFYGPDVATALAWVRGFTGTNQALERLDPGAAAGAVESLRDMLTAHAREDGVWFDSRAWLITAKRSGRRPA